MVVVVRTKDELKNALINKEEEILVIDAELSKDIGKFIERLSFDSERQFKNRVYIIGTALLLGTTLLSNLLAFGFLIVGIKVLIIPEIILFTAILILLAIKLNRLLQNDYEIVDSNEGGLFLRYRFS